GARARLARVARGATVLTAALAIVSSTGCRQSAPEARPAAAPRAAVPVITQPARVELMGIEIEAVGTTLANESVNVTSKISNTITAIRFQEGEEVERGTVLVEMDDSQARAALAEAQAALARSRSQYERSRDLRARQMLPVAEFEVVEATLKADEARADAARARLDDTVIRAPFKGRTGFRRVSVGSYVSPGSVITT